MGPPGVLALQAQVGRVAVVPVGDHGPGAGQRRVQRGEVLGSGDRPQPVLLPRPVGVGVRGRGLEQRVHEVAGGGGPVLHEQDGRGIHLHLVHASGQLVGLHRVDTLVRVDGPLLGPGGEVGEVQRPDQAAHDDAAGGVLVEVDRGSRRRGAAVPGAASWVSAGRHVLVGSGEGAGRRRVPDPAGSQHQAAERLQPQGSRHVGRRDHSAGVHRSIVGCPGPGSARRTRARRVRRAPVRRLRPGHARPRRRGLRRGSAVPGAAEHLAAVRDAGMGVAFITNNAARPPGRWPRTCASWGCRPSPEDVVTSAQAAARVLRRAARRRRPRGAARRRTGSRRRCAPRASSRSASTTEDAQAVVTGLRARRAAGATSCGPRCGSATGCRGWRATPT